MEVKVGTADWAAALAVEVPEVDRAETEGSRVEAWQETGPKEESAE